VLKEHAAPLGAVYLRFMLGDFNSARMSDSRPRDQRKTASSRRSAIFPSEIVEY